MSAWFDIELLRYLRTFTEQAAEKYLLTQGQKIVMVAAVATSAVDQGIYGLVNNLGNTTRLLLLWAT